MCTSLCFWSTLQLISHYQRKFWLYNQSFSILYIVESATVYQKKNFIKIIQKFKLIFFSIIYEYPSPINKFFKNFTTEQFCYRRNFRWIRNYFSSLIFPINLRTIQLIQNTVYKLHRGSCLSNIMAFVNLKTTIHNFDFKTSFRNYW